MFRDCFRHQDDEAKGSHDRCCTLPDGVFMSQAPNVEKAEEPDGHSLALVRRILRLLRLPARSRGVFCLVNFVRGTRCC
jgi:hypothetical protein